MSDEPFRLVKEVEFEIRCLIHGKDNISFHPRPMNLGHGRLIVDLGRAICTGITCNGSSVWLTIDLYETNTESVTKASWDVCMKAALEAEMGKRSLEETVETEPEPEEEAQVDNGKPKPSASPGGGENERPGFSRPSLRG